MQDQISKLSSEEIRICANDIEKLQKLQENEHVAQGMEAAQEKFGNNCLEVHEGLPSLPQAFRINQEIQVEGE